MELAGALNRMGFGAIIDYLVLAEHLRVHFADEADREIIRAESEDHCERSLGWAILSGARLFRRQPGFGRPHCYN